MQNENPVGQGQGHGPTENDSSQHSTLYLDPRIWLALSCPATPIPRPWNSNETVFIPCLQCLFWMVICPTYEVHEVLDACEASATRARGPCAFCTQAGISCLHAFIERPALSFILSLRRFNEGDRYRVRRILRGNLYALCVQREYPRRTAYAFIEDFADSVRMARRQVAHEAWLDEIYELEQLVENQRNRSA